MRRQFCAKVSPSTSPARCSCVDSSAAGFNIRTGLPLCNRRNSTSGRANASERTSSSIWPNSVRSARRNLRRAGTAWNRSRTSMLVPTGCAAGCVAPSSIRAPRASCARREMIDIRDTEAIDASASPRKPMLATRVKSSNVAILLVACGASASGNSSAAMPAPSSRTLISRIPPCSISISIRRAPASRLFSASSLTTDAGRSITSPAAIWFTSSGDSGRMGGITRRITGSRTFRTRFETVRRRCRGQSGSTAHTCSPAASCAAARRSFAAAHRARA